MEWLVFATGPGVLLVRRLWWFSCCAAGWYVGSQQGMALDEKEAFQMGRGHVLQTVALTLSGAVSRIDWRGVWGGLVKAREDFHAHLMAFGKGIWRDMRVAYVHVESFVRRKPSLHPNTRHTLTNLENAKKAGGLPSDALAALVAANIEGLHMRLKVLANKPADQRTRDEIYEHEHIKAQLADHYQAEPTIQPLLGVPTPGFSLTPYLLAGMVGLGGLVVTDQWRIGRLHSENAALKDWQKDAKKANTAWVEYGAKVTARLEDQSLRCVAEIDNANNKALAAEVAAAKERRRRLDVQKATIAGGGDVPLSDILRSLPGAASDSGPGDTANSNP